MTSFYNRCRAGLRWVPPLCFAIVIFFFSSIPGEEIGRSHVWLTSNLQTISATPTAKTVPSATQTLSPTLPATPSVKTLFPAFPPFPKLDWLKVGHAIGYFWLGLAVLFALPAHSRWSPSIALLLCSLYGVSDEFHQCIVPGRSASARDILLDTLAALGGVAVMLMIMGLKAFFKSKRAPAG